MERKRKTIETRLSEIDAKKAQYQAKIENYKAKITDLDSKRQGLKQTQKQKELENLLDVIRASGKTPEEVIAAIGSEETV